MDRLRDELINVMINYVSEITYVYIVNNTIIQCYNTILQY